MREILFKAKRIDNGEWVEGYLVETRHNTYHDGYRIIDKNGINYDELDYYEPSFISYVIDKTTICQCTGLKDKNGNLIWENDILSIGKKMDSIGNYYHPPVKYPTNVLVRWDLCAWLWETISKNKNEKYYISFPDAWCHYEAEVIGNIFDNPELMYE